MATSCLKCGNFDLETDFIDGRLVLLCRTCETLIDPDSDSEAQIESESSIPSLQKVNGHEQLDVNNGSQTVPVHLTCTSCGESNFETDHETDRLVCVDCGSFVEQHQVSAGSSTTGASHSESLARIVSDQQEDNHFSSFSADGEQIQVQNDTHENEYVMNEDHTVNDRPSATKCGSCGGSNLVHDADHGTEKWVCDDCGFFTEKQQLVSTQDYTAISGGTEVYRWTPAPRPRLAAESQHVNKGKESGEKTIRDIASRLNWRSDMTEQAVLLFGHVYAQKQAKHKANEFKDALGVACVYSVARENDVRVTLRTLIGFHNSKKKLITKALNLLKAVKEKPLAAQPVASLPEHILASANFPVALLDKISKLVSVCEKGFVSQGRDHHNVVISVAHLAWVSEDVPSRKSTLLPKFCSMHHLSHRRHVTLVQKDVKELFITLAAEIPWISAPVGKHNFLHYLGDIRSFGQTMVSKVLSKGLPSTVTAPAAACPLQSKAAADITLPPLAPPSMKANNIKGPKIIDPSQLFVPPHLSGNLDNEVITESDFPDGEIASYILTPEESQLKQQMINY